MQIKQFLRTTNSIMKEAYATIENFRDACFGLKKYNCKCDEWIIFCNLSRKEKSSKTQSFKFTCSRGHLYSSEHRWPPPVIKQRKGPCVRIYFLSEEYNPSNYSECTLFDSVRFASPYLIEGYLTGSQGWFLIYGCVPNANAVIFQVKSPSVLARGYRAQ